MKYSASDRLIIYIALLWELEHEGPEFMCVIIITKIDNLFRASMMEKYLPELYLQKPPNGAGAWYGSQVLAPRIAAVKEAIKLVEKKL